jgi:hypothetical protein
MSNPIYDNPQKKELLRQMGFDQEVERVELRLCPFCRLPVSDEDFRDNLSSKESRISGLCQKCQDQFFDHGE